MIRTPPMSPAAFPAAPSFPSTLLPSKGYINFRGVFQAWGLLLPLAGTTFSEPSLAVSRSNVYHLHGLLEGFHWRSSCWHGCMSCPMSCPCALDYEVGRRAGTCLDVIADQLELLQRGEADVGREIARHVIISQVQLGETCENCCRLQHAGNIPWHSPSRHILILRTQISSLQGVTHH